jgi:hypothetical protein
LKIKGDFQHYPSASSVFLLSRDIVTFSPQTIRRKGQALTTILTFAKDTVSGAGFVLKMASKYNIWDTHSANRDDEKEYVLKFGGVAGQTFNQGVRGQQDISRSAY